MPVDEFRWEANRVAGNAPQPVFKKGIVALLAHDDRVAEASEEGFPERQAGPEFQNARDADGLSRLRKQNFGRVVLDEKLVRALDHVGNGKHLAVDFRDELFGFRIVRVGGDFAPFAAVAGDKTLAVAESDDGAGAVVGAVLANHAGLVVPAQIACGFKSDKCRFVIGVGLLFLFDEFLGKKRHADGSHFSRTLRTDGDNSRELFKGAKNGVIFESSALHDDDFAEGFQIANADDFRENVLNDGTANARDNVFGLLAVTLFRNDGTIHEHGAATAELRGGLGLKRQLGDFFHGNSQGFGVGLDKGSAARRTGFVQNDAGDNAVMHRNGLHVLTADVENKGNVRTEFLCGIRMGDGFDGVIIRMDSFGKKLFAVTGRADSQNVQFTTVFFVAVGELVQRFFQNGKGLPFIARVKAVDDFFLFVH